MRFLVINPKGGCGKTTIATSLATAFANTGFSTLLADCDRQGSARTWLKRRPGNVAPVSAADWSRDISRKDTIGFNRVVIDAPAALRRKDVAELVKFADAILMPIMPSVFDEIQSKRFLAMLDRLKPIRKGKRAVALVDNRLKVRSLAARQLEAYHEKINRPPIACLRDSQFYPTAASKGLGLFDYRTQKARELAVDWQPILRFVDEAAMMYF
jgi:chromosome partitioning protein